MTKYTQPECLLTLRLINLFDAPLRNHAQYELRLIIKCSHTYYLNIVKMGLWLCFL